MKEEKNILDLQIQSAVCWWLGNGILVLPEVTSNVLHVVKLMPSHEIIWPHKMISHGCESHKRHPCMHLWIPHSYDICQLDNSKQPIHMFLHILAMTFDSYSSSWYDINLLSVSQMWSYRLYEYNCLIVSAKNLSKITASIAIYSGSVIFYPKVLSLLEPSVLQSIFLSIHLFPIDVAAS